MKFFLRTVVLAAILVSNISAQEALSGNITTNQTLTSDKTYLLKGIVRVMPGATLTIQPGTIIYGENTSQGSLIVKPGGKIMAEGTADKPIVFTSEFKKPGATKTPNYGDWGGIIILGNAPINVAGGKALIEGPGDEYGGTVADDNSGVLKYVRIEYPGIAYSLNNEINGLTLGGVGSKTKLEYIQVSYSGDDSFEFFGGTVNAKYLIAYRGWDDDFDTDFGYSGKLQFLLGVRDPAIADASQSNGFESDNDGSGSTNSPRTSPTWYNVTLIGPAATTTSTINSLYKRGMHLRRSSQNKIANALILGWPEGLLIDGTNTVADMKTGTAAFVKNSIIAGSTTVTFKSTDAAFQTDMPTWFTGLGGKTFTANADVKLADAYNLANPNPMPTTGSPVFTGAANPPADGFFDATANYIGAFGYRDWTAGWSSLSIQVPAKPSEIIAGDITTHVTLAKGKDYTLKGIVRVQSGASLTIEPGVKIYGENASQGSLVVKPGGLIFAEGTKDEPIVFTSEFTKAGSTKTPNYGDWGGIILLGKAPINVAGGKALIEGPGDEYGGTDVEDNSGVMKYVRIEYPGIAYSLNNEINGLTLGGVGNKTKLEYIQVSYSGDDSFEFFGGTVNAKYLIAYRGWDDDFDTDFGYSGKLQFLLSLRDPAIADASQSNGFESDNDGSGSTNSPRTSPTWYNVTLIGPAATTSTTFNSLFRNGMHLRRSSQNKIHNALIMGWPQGLLVDGTNTVADMKGGTAAFIKNSIISGSTTATFKSTDATFQTEMPTWFTGLGGRTFTNNADVKLSDAFNVAKPNPMPLAGSPVFTGAATPPNDGFFDTTANFVGAFGTQNWAEGWSSLVFTATDIEEETNHALPTKYELSQNYPNPFNPSTTIKFSMPKDGIVKLSVFNVLGQEVGSLVNGFKQAGSYSVSWNAGSFSSGMYFYRLETNNNVITKKMVLVK
ncbi:MAG: hypothetical protein A2499_09075 [Stygiobacter sp. RIFOXYC12_FULL_38_8]|nr:MAG: hypothetical protein A2X62_16930 [Stygiobacter sp. GWC2_38_9]OGU77905.1 MAG: hypothetical protein A2279_02850 [Stygiobacter sp. RIFOXYA12_FULL_38_9]OGV09028.1 MAG: hypothetical protein A2299_11395 [Stygiobacter sp. RIFOXYB2_FULL_37_11]OGV14156.1 MAG: hypothetical protein A2237_13475 [Stygiobacter sp. RIFOXYA2_FULL_38_8]OGV16254.1 MAG: hypothetical protein A2440_04300 [Stygiobacter sp. RIFOXYC2_FULL_38_25]OGV28607.1 MAG: hypothetical protein A2499_09075 [Stygiobacter sp. RIFOXYC12_FULL_